MVQKDKIYIVYCTTNIINNKKYIGVHGCFSLTDGYIGSGYALKEAIKKYGKDSFSREVLFTFKTEEEAYKKEQELVGVDKVNNIDYYNMSVGGRVPKNISQESKDKWISKLKGRKSKSKLKIKVKATHIRTLEVREFDSILECSRVLNLSYSAILKVCKRRYGMTHCREWTFETSKYGKSLPVKNKDTLGIDIQRGKYVASFGKKVLGRYNTIEDSVESQLNFVKSFNPKNKAQSSLKKKYEMYLSSFPKRS